MSRFDKLFGRKSGPTTPAAVERPQVRLPALVMALAACRPALERKDVEPGLLRARLGDFHRDQGLEPVQPDFYLEQCETLDVEGLRRLALVTEVLGAVTVGAAVADLARSQGVGHQVREGFVGFAREAKLLTLELLGQSPLRTEELARRWVKALGAGIEGESEEESTQRLARLDYAKLLEEAERAKQAAEGRQEKLKKLREEQDARIAPRGKW